jgi:hypothetical protein
MVVELGSKPQLLPVMALVIIQRVLTGMLRYDVGLVGARNHG